MNEEVKRNYEEEILNSYNKIINTVKAYNPNCNEELIAKAFEAANEAHKGVCRDSGEPYIFHPIGVVNTLCELGLDDASICAGFLHDVVEDVEGWTIKRIEEEFNKEIADLVDGLTKLSNQDFTTDYIDGGTDPSFDIDKKKKYFVKNAANMRKIFVAMSKDMRVMVIKLADRLHNMKTLDSLSEERQKRMARETIQIFAPIAHRLGIYTLKSQLEDLSFKYLYPEECNKLEQALKDTKEYRKIMLEMCVEQLKDVLKENHIDARIESRTKTLWSIRNKMVKKKCNFEDIKDLLAVRIIVKTQEECYHALGVVHGLWMSISGEFSDYISMPKPNGYKSLHTKVVINGEPLEVQIRTEDMHNTAELGVAAHWRYKERSISGDFFERKMSFLRKRLFEWQKGNETAEEYFDALVNELFGEQVFIFTPRGDVIDLKAGATAIDFAYRIHSDVGNQCVGAKVNGIIVPINHVLQNQDIVEIISRPNATPSMDWLKFVTTNTAKTRIKQFFKKKDSDSYEIMGRDIVNKIISERGLDKNEILTSENIKIFIDNNNIKTEKDLFVNIGFGVISPEYVVNKILSKNNKSTKNNVKAPVTSKVIKEESSLEMAFDGIENMLFTRGKCCEPLPGEDVVGYVTIGKGITLHSADCTNVAAIRQKKSERLKPYNWKSKDEAYPTSIRLKANGQIGVINEITTIILSEKTPLQSINSFIDKEKYLNIDLIVMVKTHQQLDSLINKLKNIQNMLDVYRPVSRIRDKE